VDLKGALSAQGQKCAGIWRTVLLCLVIGLIPRSLQAEDAYQIKAAFIFNFTKFVTWPDELERQGGDLRLCLFKENPFGDYIFNLDGRKVRNFYLRVSLPSSQAELSQCHIIFLPPMKSTATLLGELAAQPILTISDVDGFSQGGGGIELLSESNRIRFDVNLQRIKGSGLDISSKLLHLARKVY